MSTTEAEARPIRSLIPARLDRLHWSPFHPRMACGLRAASRNHANNQRPAPGGSMRISGNSWRNSRSTCIRLSVPFGGFHRTWVVRSESLRDWGADGER